jgi:hypothetical protein
VESRWVAIVGKVSCAWCNRRLYEVMIRCRGMNESKGRNKVIFSKMNNAHKATRSLSCA